MTYYTFCNIDSDNNPDIANAKLRKKQKKTDKNQNSDKRYNELDDIDNSSSLSNAKSIDIYKESKISNNKKENDISNIEDEKEASMSDDVNDSGVEINNDIAQPASESEKASSGDIWKKVGIAAAAVAGTAAVGTGLYFGINALLKKNSNDNNTNDDKNNVDNSKESNSDLVSGGKSKFISINIDNYSITRRKLESNSLRSSFDTIDSKLLSIIDKTTIPSGDNYIENKETAKILKDSYSYIISNTAKTASMFDIIINSSGGKNADGVSHKTVLRNNLSSKINRMKEIEKLLSNPIVTNANTLQNEYEKLGKDIGEFISDYANKNDSSNGTNELKYDLYFDVNSFQKESAEYISNNKVYFPEYNISKSSINSIPIDDTIKKLSSISPQSSEEKLKLEGIKSILNTVNSGIPFSDKEIDMVESLLNGDEIKKFEEKYNIAISEYIGHAKNKIDSGNKSVELLDTKELNIENFDQSNQVVSDDKLNNVEYSNKNTNNYVDEKNTPEELAKDKKDVLKKKLMDAIENGVPLDRESINQISLQENAGILSNEILKDFFSKEKSSVQVLDEYYKCIDNNQKISESLVSTIINDQYSLNRLKEEKPEYYKKVQLQNKGYQIEKKISSNNFTKNDILKLISNSDFAEIVKENEYLVPKLTDRIESFNKLDKFCSKKNLSISDFKEINLSSDLKSIIINDPSYKNLYSDFVKLQNINNMVVNIVNDIECGKEVNHEELCYVMNDDIGRSFVNNNNAETIKKIEELHSNIVEKYINDDEVKNNINEIETSHTEYGNEHALLTTVEEKNGEIPEIDSSTKIDEKEKEDIVTKVAKYGVLGTAVEAFVDNINKNINQENVEYNHESPSESVYNVHENEHYDVHKTASFNANKAKKE